MGCCASGAAGVAVEAPDGERKGSVLKRRGSNETREDTIARRRRSFVSLADPGERNVEAEKSDTLKEAIFTSLTHYSIFRTVAPSVVRSTVELMYQVRFHPGDVIVMQGEPGEQMFWIESGVLDVVKHGEEPSMEERVPQGQVLQQLQPGQTFGEISIVNRFPRSASVICKERAVLWALDMQDMLRALPIEQRKRRELHQVFLETVNVLESLTAYHLCMIAYALRPREFAQGDVVVRQGDEGDSFYVIEEGEAVVTRTDRKGREHEVNRLKKGDYFGEVALLRKQNRMATLTAATPMTCLVLHRDDFERFMRPAHEQMEQAMGAYAVPVEAEQ